MGGGRRTASSNSHKKKNKASNSRRGGSNSKSFGRGRLFVEGGCLADWQLESPSHNHDQGRKLSSEKKSRVIVGNVRRQVSATRDGTRKHSGTGIGYQYPSADLQGTLCSDESNGNVNRNEEKTLVLLNPRGSEVVAYLDQTAPSNHSNVEYTYSYGSDFVLGESSHKGLGFCNEPKVTPISAGVSGKKVEDASAIGVPSSSFEKDVNVADVIDYDAEGETIEELTSETSPVNNLGFLSIGGVKLYTQDMSGVESDEDNTDLQGASESDEVCFSESDSEDIFDTDSDIDEDIVQDYLEGIGGSENIIDAKWLLGPALSQSDEESSSSSGFDETLEKLSGIALQEASTKYGLKKVKSRKRYCTPAKHALLSPLDDLMLVKDKKNISAKKKHVSYSPHSWPVEDRRSKTNRRFPGEKKKYRKEMIASKRRERMLHRGFDIQKINSKLEEIVLDGVDMFTFQPMHPRDCSQVRRLAAIYGLRTSCQGSGKKRFVMVTRTQHTSIPSASDKLRLKKLLGAGGEDADFALINVADRKKAAEGNAFSALEQLQRPSTRTSKRSATPRNKGVRNMNGSERKSSYANQPMSFVSSGVMNSETEVTAIHIEEADGNHNVGIRSSENIGSFEVHTKGFGSKMMAKMGYTEGRGLGKDGQGSATPIEVIQRPKSLGLGMDFSNNAAEPVKTKSLISDAGAGADAGASASASAESSINKPRKIGTFEKHTKGFGSKMMAKMGFVEGTGLGRNAQGMTIPLAAVRLPKSRGLGATARS